MKTLRLFVAWIAAAFSAILSANKPPTFNPVVRFNENPFSKRIYGKAISGSQAVRAFMLSVLNAPNRLLSMSGFSPRMLEAGLINTFLEPLPVFEFQAARDKADLPQSLYIEEILCVISGQLDVEAGGGADGTLNTEPIARLVDEIRVTWDGFDLVGPINGRDLAALSRRLQSQALTTQDITAPGIQAATIFSLPFLIPFNRRYLADPFDTVLPPLEVKNEFVLSVRWNTARANAQATTTAGSGAITTGGTRNVILSNVQMTATPRVARDGKKPWAIPVISTYETRQFQAADPRLPLDMRSPMTFDAVMFRTLEDALQDPADLVAEWTFKSSQVRILNEVSSATIRAYEETVFPGVQAASEVGTNMILLADGGKLGNAVNPAELSNPMFEFNVATPNNNPGFLRAVVMELLSVEGVTRN